MLTCYDAAFARVLDDAGVDSLLIGDSLGMVLQGRGEHSRRDPSNDMVYHTGWRGTGQSHGLGHRRHALWSYRNLPKQRCAHAVLLMQQGDTW